MSASTSLSAAAFDIEAFLRLAAERLHPTPPPGARRGDHDLVPNGPRYEVTRPAAVLVPIVPRPAGAQVLLTLRSPNLPTHAGQIAFPGGKIEPGDADALAAALREAQEEVGLAPEMVRPLGYLDTYVSSTGFGVVPVVGLLRPDYALALNPEEVDEAFEVPLAFLMSADNHTIGERVLRGTTRRFYVMAYEQRHIWGITAGILRNLYDVIYGE